MISSKHLVTFCCLLLVGSGAGWAASADTDGGSSTATTSSDTAATTTTTSHKHHRKHHGDTATDATSSTGAATSTTTPKANSGTAAESVAKTPATPNSKKENGNNTTAPAAVTAPATASTTSTTHRSKKKHGASTAANTPTPPPANPPATAAGKTSTSTPAASPATPSTGIGAPPNGQAVATTQTAGTPAKNGRHRHHGKSTTVATQPAAPEIPAKTATAPIVMTPATTPLAPQTSVTLPVTAPLSGVKLPATSGVPTVLTGLPVARPGTGTTATLPIGMVRTTPPVSHFPFIDYPSRRHSQTYPWKTSIVTTVFWIGEDASAVSSATNHSSAWDINWEHNNGGTDSQYDLNGYAPSQHAALLNPFYVALPFNDLAYPDEAARWLPSNWNRPSRRDGKPVSACQGRWVEIKNRAGRVCFAQWEDVGPLVTDNVEYVFGPERPSARAGLDVSPAVAKYLGIDSTAYTSWRFVDDEDVQPGMWLRYDEQALLFRALEEQMHGSRTRALQDMEEPVPDDSDNNANQKKAGAARG
jgi:hypothetical protein